MPSERILVEDCDFAAGHGGVTVGSEMSAGAVGQAVITIDFYYEEDPGHLRGCPDDPVGDIRLSNVHFQHTNQPSIVSNVAGLVLDKVHENGAPMSV